MKSETTPEKINAFMAALGNAVRSPGTVYLVGGTSALLQGWRQMTVDIDLKADPVPEYFFEAIDEIKNDLDVNVELASPDQFIPELPGWKDRSPRIGKTGALEFYHYDFYAQALAKIERGHLRDLNDVHEMERRGLIRREEVFKLFSQIQNQLIRFPSINAAAFGFAVAGYCQKR